MLSIRSILVTFR